MWGPGGKVVKVVSKAVERLALVGVLTRCKDGAITHPGLITLTFNGLVGELLALTLLQLCECL